MLNLRKGSTQTELNDFFEGNQSLPTVTKSAFSQARKGLSAKAFTALNQISMGSFYQQYTDYKTWKGFRLCAIDGSKLRIPKNAEMIETFGEHKGKQNQPDCPMALMSCYYDVLNHLILDADIYETTTNEKLAAIHHLDRVQRDNDLILYDRGYNGFWFYAWHRQHHQPFCMRAKTEQLKAVKEFVSSGKRQSTITLWPNKPSEETCWEYGLSTAPITLRVIRVDLPGEVEVLITNLTDKKTYPARIFKDLYHLRWRIEEGFKQLKQWVEIENLSGKSVLCLKQDIYAKLLATNLTTLLSMSAQEQVDTATEKHKHRYKINFAQALSVMKHRIIHLLQASDRQWRKLAENIVQMMASQKEAIRPGRHFERESTNLKRKLHNMTYKRAL